MTVKRKQIGRIMGDKPRAELFGALYSLYQTRDYSDLVLFARDGSRYPVHKAILCPRSQYFADAVKNRRWRDSGEGHITLPEDDAEVVRLLVEYFYLLDYEPMAQAPHPPPKDLGQDDDDSSRSNSDTMSIRTAPVQYGHVYGTSAVSAFGGPASPFSTNFPSPRGRADSSLTVHAIPSTGFPERPRRNKSHLSTISTIPEPSPLATSEPNLVLHARMYAAGHRYGVDGLKALALDKFKIQLTRHWDSAEFAEAIHVVYDTTPSHDKDMREAVADTLGWHGRLLDKAEIEVAVMEINGLAYELLKRSRRSEWEPE